MPKSPSRRLPALAAGALALVAGVTCTDGGLTGPSSLRAALSLAPSFSRAALDIYRNLASFEFSPDNLHLRLLRTNETVVIDTVVALTPGQDSVVLNLGVTLEKSPETFQAKIDIRDGTQVLFSGTQTIVAHAGTTAPTPPPIELEYAGPGSEVVALDVSPDTTIFVSDSVAMRAVGFASNEQVVNDLALEWSLNDATMGSISGTGVFRPAKRGTAIVTATLPTGVAGSATVSVVAPPASLALVSGGNQSGITGSVLPQPIVVEVRASDNLPSAGISVTFAVTAGGGSVNPTTAVTGTDGRASTVLTLGTAAGTNSVEVSASGLTPVTVSATATTPQPATRTWVGPASGIWETPANWSGGIVPMALDTVLLNGPADYIISISSAVTVARLTLGTATGQQALVVTGPSGTLTVTDSIRIATSGLLLLGASASETILTSGPIVVDGILELLNGTIAGSGNIDVSTNGSFLISGDAAMGLTNRVIRNAGLTFLAADVGSLQLHNGSRIENLANGEFMTQGEIDIAQGTGAVGSVRNDGLYQMITAGVGTHTIGVAFENNGTIEMFNGTMAFTGPSVVNSSTGSMRGTGTLSLGATTVQQAGIIEPGLSPGLLSFTGALPLQASSRVNIELGGTTAETGYDVVAVSGAVTFAGTLDVSVINGYTPVAGDSLTVIRYASHTGTFDTVVGLALGGGLFLDPVYTTTGLSLVVRQSTPAGISWINAAGGNWSVASNWSTGVVPGATDNVSIDLPGTYTVTLDVNPTIAGLTVGGTGASATLSATSRTLSLNGAMVVMPSGTLNLVTSSITGAGTFSNAGLVTMQGGSIAVGVNITNNGTIRTHGAVSINGALSTSAPSSIRAVGQNTGGTAALTIANGFFNHGLIELTSTNGHAASLTVTNGTLTNSNDGTIQTTSSGTRTLAAQLNNQGILNVDALLTINRASATHVNSGSIDLTTADLVLTQTGTAPSFTNTSTGVVTLAASRDFTVTGGLLDIDQGSVTGPATARLVVSGASLAFTTGNIGPLPLTLTTTTIVGGAVTVPTGQTLTLLNGGLSDPVTVESGGVLLLHGAVSLTGALTLPTGSTMRLMGQNTGGTSALTLANSFTNSGTVEMTSTNGHAATLTVTTGTLTNAPGGLLRTLSSGTRTLNAQLDNQGTLEVDAALTMNRADADHVNSGTIDLTTADLTVTQAGASPTFTSTGTVTLGASRDWTVTGGLLDIDQGTVNGPLSARLIVTNGALAFTTANVGLLPLTLTNTTIEGGSVTIPAGQTLTLLNGGLSDAVTVEGGGTLLTHGAVSLSGTVTLPTGSTLRLMGQNTGGTAALTITTTVVNNGTIELASTNGHAATLALPTVSTRLVNSSGALVRSLASGTRTLAAELDNQGTLEVDNALTINRTETDHINTGTIDLTTADLTVTQTGTTPSFTSAGTVTLGAGRDWTVTGGLLDIDQGAVTGPTSARLIVNNATLAFTTANVGLLPLTLNNTMIQGGAVSIPGGETLTLLNGGLSDPVTVLSGGTLLVHGAVSLAGALNLPTCSMLRLMGQNTGGTSALTIATNVVNNGTIELTSTNGHASTLTMATTTLTNSPGALIRSLTSGTRTLAVELDNQGTLEVDAPLTMNRGSASHTNSGTIDLTAADLVVSQSGATSNFTNTGTVTLGASRDWAVTGGRLDLDQGIVSGPATARLIVNTAILAFTTGNVLLPLTLNTTAIEGGAVSIPGGETLTLLNGGLSDPVTVLSGGTLLVHGAVSLTGALNLPTGSMLRLLGQNTGGTSALTLGTNVVNNGTIELTSTNGHAATLSMPTTTLTNSSGGLIRSLTSGTRTLAVELDNQGTLEVDALLTINRAGAGHLNTGTIDLTTADLVVTQTGTTPSFTSVGTVTLGASRDWTVNGGTLDIDQGTVTGPVSARLIVNNATMQVTTANIGLLPLTLTNTTIPGGLTIPVGQTLTLLNGGIADAINVQGGGTLLVHGTVSLSGAVSLPTGSVLRLMGQNTGGTADLTLAQNLTNNGTIELRSTNGHAAILNMPTATLTNATGGQIVSMDAGTRTLNLQLDNQGMFDVNANTSLQRTDAVHTNSGTIDVTDASFALGFGTVVQSFTNVSTGVVTIGANRTFATNGAAFDVDEGLVTGDPALARLIIQNGSVAFTPTTVTVPLTLTNSSVVGGQVTVNNAETLTLYAANVNDAVAVNAGGTLRVIGATSLNGTVATAGTIQLLGQNTGGTSALTVLNGFTNQGLIELTSTNGHTANLTVTNGTLINASGATLSSTATGTRNLFAQLDNQGTFQVNSTIGLNRANAQHVNSGTINVAGGNLDVPQTGTTPSFANTGTINIAGTRQLGITGGTVANNGSGAVIQGTGTLSLLNNTLVNNGRLRPAGAATAGTLTITGGSWSQIDPNGALDIEIGGTTIGTFDRMIASAATLGGALNVSVINGFNVPPGQQYTILSGGTYTGTFNLVAPLGWTISYPGGNTVVLTAPAP
ncbi:MAG TPA: hypothetical protein VEB19_06510 [Gemmatimonadaceae bacterium]|nr:hypothetical protein [Gemmatimonadaceae bacterium]